MHGDLPGGAGGFPRPPGASPPSREWTWRNARSHASVGCMIGSFQCGWRRLAALTMSLSFVAPGGGGVTRRLTGACRRDDLHEVLGQEWMDVVHGGSFGLLAGGWLELRGCAWAWAVTGSAIVASKRRETWARGARRCCARQATTGTRPPRRASECDPGDAGERHRTEIGGDNLRRFNLQHVVPPFVCSSRAQMMMSRSGRLIQTSFAAARRPRFACSWRRSSSGCCPTPSTVGSDGSLFVGGCSLLSWRRGSAHRCSSTTSSTSGRDVATPSPPSVPAG